LESLEHLFVSACDPARAVWAPLCVDYRDKQTLPLAESISPSTTSTKTAHISLRFTCTRQQGKPSNTNPNPRPDRHDLFLLHKPHHVVAISAALLTIGKQYCQSDIFEVRRKKGGLSRDQGEGLWNEDGAGCPAANLSRCGGEPSLTFRPAPPALRFSFSAV
jgi:hypothetical protein